MCFSTCVLCLQPWSWKKGFMFHDFSLRKKDGYGKRKQCHMIMIIVTIIIPKKTYLFTEYNSKSNKIHYRLHFSFCFPFPMRVYEMLGFLFGTKKRRKLAAEVEMCRQIILRFFRYRWEKNILQTFLYDCNEQRVRLFVVPFSFCKSAVCQFI